MYFELLKNKVSREHREREREGERERGSGKKSQLSGIVVWKGVRQQTRSKVTNFEREWNLQRKEWWLFY